MDICFLFANTRRFCAFFYVVFSDFSIVVYDYMFYVSSATNTTLTLFRLKISFSLCSMWKCLCNKFRNTRPMLVDTLLLYGGLYQMMLLLQFLDGLFSLIVLS